jgi:hypothetical protein
MDIKYKGEVIPGVNQMPQHKGVWGSGYIAPRILNLSAIWR